MAIVQRGRCRKLAVYERILRAQALTDEEVAYMGDDLLDLPVLARVGLAAAPADAVPDVRDAGRTGSAAVPADTGRSVNWSNWCCGPGSLGRDASGTTAGRTTA